MSRVRKAVAALAIGLLIVAAWAVVRRHEVAHASMVAAARWAGYDLRFSNVYVAPDGISMSDAHVERDGKPLFSASRIDVRYDVRGLLPGSAHRFGLTSISLERPQLSVEKDASGNYNVEVPAATEGGPALPAFPNRVPLHFTFDVRDGEVRFRAPSAEPAGRDFRIGDIDGRGLVDTGRRTHYAVDGAFLTRSPEPFSVTGTIDVERGFAMHHARAARLPVREIADFFLSGDVANVLAGSGTNFDARLYAIGATDVWTAPYHASASIDADDVSLALSLLDRPIEHLRGHLDVVDDAFFTQRVDGSLSGTAFTAAGSIFDVSDPKVQLSITGAGDLSQLRAAFAFAKTQPVSGGVSLRVALSGALADPVIAIRADAPQAAYARVPVNDLHASVLVHDSVIALMPLQGSYGGALVGLRGTLTVGPAVQSDVVAHLSSPARRLPFLGELLGDEGIVGDAIFRGRDLGFHARGAFASARGIARVAALAVADPNGTVAVAPFRIDTERGRFDGGYELDRPHDSSAFWGALSDFALRAPAGQTFPGLTLPQVPPIDTHVSNALIAGTGSGRDVAIGGSITARDADVSHFRFDSIEAAFAGSMQGAEITVLRARGPWGSFDGRGAFSTAALAARGAYKGTLEGLQPYMGGLPAHGSVDGTAAVALQNDAVVVQAQDIALHDAEIHGIPLQHVNGTMEVRGGSVRVYSAHARAAGGDVVAAGTYGPGTTIPGGLALIATGIDGAHLHGLGLPLSAGRVSTAGTLAAGAPLPAFDGTFALSDGRTNGMRVAGTGVLGTRGDAATIGSGIVALGGSFAFLSGSIGALSSSAPAYALHAEVPAADVADSLHALNLPNYATAGTFSADLAVTGSGLMPFVRGPIVVGGGDVNGLAFVDGRAYVQAGGASLEASDGSVLVATTQARFAALSQPRHSALSVAAPVADLSDFNNFFDTGDTLDGSGSIAFHANVADAIVHTGGDIDIRGLRYRNLPLGDTRARWSSESGTLTGTLRVGGDEGRLAADGSIGIAPAQTWQSTIRGSRYDLSANVSDLDLSLWVAALGFPQLPITGRANGQVRVDGRYPHLSIRGNADVLDGTIANLPLERFEVAGHSDGDRVTIDEGALAVPGLQAGASGVFGLQPDAPVAVRVHASTDDIPLLLARAQHAPPQIEGSIEMTVDVGGVVRAPTFGGAFDADKLTYRGVTIDSLFGQVRYNANRLELSNAGALLGGGNVTLAGALPLELSPFRVGPEHSALNFDVGIVAVDPAFLEPLLGHNTKLGGQIDGHFGLAGTVGAPRIFGNLALKKGSYVSDLQRVPITDTVGSIVFDNQRAQLEHLSSRFGSGTVEAAGHVTFASAGNAVYAFDGSARNAQLDVPAYGQGTVNGHATLTRAAHGDALLAGEATAQDATVLFAAFVAASQGAQAGAAAVAPLPVDVGLDLNLKAGRNVRVRGGTGFGAGLDIGATGAVSVKGTLAQPSLDGTFTSTGGTLTYFDRSFRVRSGVVAFSPSDGLLPTLDAVAVTNVTNPDPDPRRNAFGSAEITITVTGRVDNMQIDFASNPPGYSREQILAMIAPFGGFVTPIAYQAATPGSGVPGAAPQDYSISVGAEAFNLLNAQFSAALLAPLETALGRGLGLSDVNLTLNYNGNVGFSARRPLGPYVTFTFSQTFGIPNYTAFGLLYNRGGLSSAELTFFNQTGQPRLSEAGRISAEPGLPLSIGQPIGEGSGFSFTYQRLFR